MKTFPPLLNFFCRGELVTSLSLNRKIRCSMLTMVPASCLILKKYHPDQIINEPGNANQKVACNVLFFYQLPINLEKKVIPNKHCEILSFFFFFFIFCLILTQFDNNAQKFQVFVFLRIT